MKFSFNIDRYKVTVFDPETAGCPVIYFNTMDEQADTVWNLSRKTVSRPSILAAITNLDWDADLSPWYCPSASPSDRPCQGKAAEYLDTLVEKIIPETEWRIARPVDQRILAGYSLAGLFADYALYKCPLFHGVVIGSGSFWFPDYLEYAVTTALQSRPEKMYFSLGRQESKTRILMFQNVERNTEELVHYYQSLGIDTVFELVNGNHFTDPLKRMADGIEWILKD